MSWGSLHPGLGFFFIPILAYACVQTPWFLVAGLLDMPDMGIAPANGLATSLNYPLFFPGGALNL